jgi:hypothetical protein
MFREYKKGAEKLKLWEALEMRPTRRIARRGRLCKTCERSRIENISCRHGIFYRSDLDLAEEGTRSICGALRLDQMLSQVLLIESSISFDKAESWHSK